METDESSRIDRSLLPASRPPLSAAAESYFEKLLAKYGTHLAKVILLPNFSYENTTMPPAGVAYVFSRDAPMFAEPFHPNKFATWGVAQYEMRSRIPDRPLNEAYFTEASRGILSKMCAALGDDADGPTLACLDAATGRDKRDASWLPVLGGQSSYAEINRCIKKEGNRRREQWVLTIATALPRVSRELLEIIERREKIEASKSETTLTIANALSMPEVRYAELLGKRNRNRAAARIARALDVDIATCDDLGCQSKELVGMPLVENLSYHVREYDGKFVYYAGATSTMDCKGGIILGQTATLGPLLLHGYPGRHSSSGGPWSVPAYYNAFPIGTGRCTSNQKLYAGYERDECSREQPGCKFTWRGESRHNLRLDNVHNVRNPEFALIEERLGRKAAWGESELQVIFAVLQPSTRPAASSKQRV